MLFKPVQFPNAASPIYCTLFGTRGECVERRVGRWNVRALAKIRHERLAHEIHAPAVDLRVNLQTRQNLAALDDRLDDRHSVDEHKITECLAEMILRVGNAMTVDMDHRPQFLRLWIGEFLGYLQELPDEADAVGLVDLLSTRSCHDDSPDGRSAQSNPLEFAIPLLDLGKLRFNGLVVIRTLALLFGTGLADALLVEPGHRPAVTQDGPTTITLLLRVELFHLDLLMRQMRRCDHARQR